MLKSLLEVCGVFFKLGWVAFGGPAAHIALLEAELVSKRGWMSREHFLDLLGVTHLIPGPNSTEMAIHCGYHRAGWPGLIAAGVCFIFPAFVLTLAGGMLYAAYGQLPQAESALNGIRPVIIVIIAMAVVKIGQKAVKNGGLVVTMIAAALLSFLGVSEVFVLFGGAGVYSAWMLWGKKKWLACLVWPLAAVVPLKALAAEASDLSAVTGTKLFPVFLKIGAILFGSGYVLIAYLNQELIEQRQWLTPDVLMDAVAFGQVTPGPVLTTATFIGYQLAGVSGAIWATVGIFLPSFIFVLLVNPLVPKLRGSKIFSVLLDGVNASVVGLIAAVCVKLAFLVLRGPFPILMCIAAALLIWRFPKISIVWWIVVSGLAGYAVSLI